MAFTVVHYETKYGAKDGVATSWLEKLVQPITSGEESAGFAGLRVPVFLRRCGLASFPAKDVGSPRSNAPYSWFWDLLLLLDSLLPTCLLQWLC